MWWKALTDVCRRWRYIILASPRRLDLRILCTEKTPAATLLDIWPPFPITLSCFPPYLDTVNDKNVQNLIAAVEHRNRTSKLTHVEISSEDEFMPVLPETFLGGSAQRLQSFALQGIGFPSFPKFVLSATHIVKLHLTGIPDSGYISPRAMAPCLSALPHLEHLSIGFRSPLSRPLRISPPPLTRAVLPSLVDLSFYGVSEYFEAFVARVDTPLLKYLSLTFFMDLIFDIPRLHDFIGRAESLGPFRQATVCFVGPLIEIILSSGTETSFELKIKCERPDWQLASMTQIFNQQLPLLSHVEQLDIYDLGSDDMKWKDDSDMDPLLWLELFHLFIAVQSLYLSKTLVPIVAAALQELTGERTMEVLPALRNISLQGPRPSGPVQEAIKSFGVARQLFNHPVVIDFKIDRAQATFSDLLLPYKIPPLREERFNGVFMQFTAATGIRLTESDITIEGRRFNLWALHKVVFLRNGFETVCANDEWPIIGAVLGFPLFSGGDGGQPARCGPAVAHRLQQLYNDVLRHFDQAYINSIVSRMRAASQASLRPC